MNNKLFYDIIKQLPQFQIFQEEDEDDTSEFDFVNLLNGARLAFEYEEVEVEPPQDQAPIPTIILEKSAEKKSLFHSLFGDHSTSPSIDEDQPVAVWIDEVPTDEAPTYETASYEYKIYSAKDKINFCFVHILQAFSTGLISFEKTEELKKVLHEQTLLIKD